MHVAFFIVALQIFTNNNKFLQRNDFLPHKVVPRTKSLARKIAGRFILRDKFQSDITINLIENEDNYVSLKDVFLGPMTESKLNDLLENGDISEVQYEKFIVGAIELYKVSLKYVLEKQFHEYKTINDVELPDEAYEKALLSGTSDSHKKEYRVDVLLGLIIGLSYCLKLYELF